MKQRWLEVFFLVFLIGTPSFAATKDLPSKLQLDSRRTSVHREKRQLDDVLNSVVQLAIRLVPIVMTTFFGPGGEAGQAAATAALDKIDQGLNSSSSSSSSTASPTASDTKLSPVSNEKKDKLGLADTSDTFSLPNLLSMAVKVALSLVTAYTSGSGGLDRNGEAISPLQTVIGTLISAMTGSENPKEVAIMAKQAAEVIGLIGTLGEALRTSVAG